MTHDETVERELLREALSALEPWAKAAAVLDMPGAAENTGDGQPFEDDEILWGGETGDLTVADFRRARAAADKIRAALNHQQKGEGL